MYSSTDVLVIGAGSVGLSAAYYLKKNHPKLSVTLVDNAEPLSLTSAQSGENYRNWWPHPFMKRFMDRSIDLMETIATATNNHINLNRKGYLLATRDPSPKAILDNLAATYTLPDSLRWHSAGESYAATLSPGSIDQVTGVDIVDSTALIRQHYPYLSTELNTLIHIRHAGTLSAQQLGSYMQTEFKAGGGEFLKGEVIDIDAGSEFNVSIANGEETQVLQVNNIVNAAGPFANNVAQQLGVDLPVFNVLQQKIAFEDIHGAVDRNMPFAIDLDEQTIDWTDAEREALSEESQYAHLLKTMTGSIHCRPEGSTWIKLGWAFNTAQSSATREPLLDDHFPEIVVRGASRLLPSLGTYTDGFPKNFSHYGGYYTMTEENWPLIGPTDIKGFFVATGLSGFGTMAACVCGELISQWVTDSELPEYAIPMSLARYQDQSLMQEISNLQSRGIL